LSFFQAHQRLRSPGFVPAIGERSNCIAALSACGIQVAARPRAGPARRSTPNSPYASPPARDKPPAIGEGQLHVPSSGDARPRSPTPVAEAPNVLSPRYLTPVTSRPARRSSHRTPGRHAARVIDLADGRPGIAVWQNNGVPANQTIGHLHFHVAGTLDTGGTEWGDVPELSVAETDAIAEKLHRAEGS
jgi:hypothetical protein